MTHIAVQARQELVMLATTTIDAAEVGSGSITVELFVVEPSLLSAAVAMALVVLALAVGLADATTTGVDITGAVIVGAAVITDSPLQSAAAIAMSVWALIPAEAPTIVVERAVAVLTLATFTLKLVFTETVPESRRTAVERRRAPSVKPVMVMSEAATDRAAAKPVFLAVL